VSVQRCHQREIFTPNDIFKNAPSPSSADSKLSVGGGSPHEEVLTIIRGPVRSNGTTQSGLTWGHTRAL